MVSHLVAAFTRIISAFKRNDEPEERTTRFHAATIGNATHHDVGGKRINCNGGRSAIAFSRKAVKADTPIVLRFTTSGQGFLVLIGFTSCNPKTLITAPPDLDAVESLRYRSALLDSGGYARYGQLSYYVPDRSEATLRVNTSGLIYADVLGTDVRVELQKDSIEVIDEPVWAVVEVLSADVRGTIELLDRGEYLWPEANGEDVNASRRLGSECVVCLDRAIDGQMAFNTCGHMATCSECAVMIYNNRRECPICRQRITNLLRLYRPD